MELRNIANAIGVETYPEELEAVFAALPCSDAPACDLALIDKLQEEWNFFAEFYPLVRETAEAVNRDENRSLWVKTAVAYDISRTVKEAKRVPVPKADGTQVTALLPLYILLPMFPMAIDEYARRGFSREEIARIMAGIPGGIRIVKEQTELPGVNQTYYGWLMLFAKARIFYADQLQIELFQSPSHVVYLKHKVTGQLVPVFYDTFLHRSGENLLGSVGYEDVEGAIAAKFREDAENFHGYACVDDVIDTEEKVFPKAEWEAHLRPGDDCLNMHIPRGTDISVPAMLRYFELGRKIAKERYPEHRGDAIYALSWILDPKLEDIMGPDSNIVKMLKLFVKYPQKTDGNHMFAFVFGGKPNNYEELPEKSTLQRGLKKLLLSGGHNYPHAGIYRD